MSSIDARIEAVAAELADELVDTSGSSLVGVYVHGSAVLGDFMPDVSDLDLLVVVEDDPSDDLTEALAVVLARDRDVPATGIEASVVERSAAAAPGPPWGFRVHVTTDPGDRKVVWGRGHAGDPDLALHYPVVRNAGWTAYGHRPVDVIGEVHPDHVLHQLREELQWAAEEAPDSYAILNACRALRYVEEGVICSKTDGGVWALTRGIRPDLVRRALASRREGSKQPALADSRQWVVAVANELSLP